MPNTNCNKKNCKNEASRRSRQQRKDKTHEVCVLLMSFLVKFKLKLMTEAEKELKRYKSNRQKL